MTGKKERHQQTTKKAKCWTMASFVREVLSATGRLGEKEDFGGKAARLKLRVDDLKANLRVGIESRYEDFSVSFAEVSTAVAQLENILHEVEALENAVNTHLKPNLTDVGKEAAEISKQLKDLSHSVQVANLIRQLYVDTEKANELLEAKQYLETSDILRNVQLKLDNIDAKDDEDAQRSIDAINKEIANLKQKNCYILSKDWDENVKVSPTFDDDENLESTQLEINFQFDDNQLSRLVSAMHLNDILSFRIQKLCQGIMKNIIKPLMKRKATLELAETNLALHFTSEDENIGPSKALSVIDFLEKVFLFLSNHFNFQLGGENLSMTSKLGDLICPPVIEILLKDCLIPSVPEDQAELDNYETYVISSLKMLHSSLVSKNLIQEDDQHSVSLLKFTRDINDNFINKRCKSILSEARVLMKKDLHKSENVGSGSMSQKEAEEILATATNVDWKNVDMDYEEELLPLPQGLTLNDGLFRFPTCQVSSAVIAISNLVQKTVSEAIEANELHYTGRLLATARNIFEMYNDILPIFHRESLKSLPMNSALGYNNCMYLAHQCLTTFVPAEKLPSPLKERALTFADLVPRLRQTGSEVLLAQMRRLRDQLRSMLRDSVTGFGQLDGSNLLPASSEKCIKQIIHQLMHLQSVWKDCLPLSIFRRSIGTILNTVVEELVQRVVVLEDIAADAAVQICMHFSLLQDQGPKVFVIEGKSETSKGDILRYVKKWNRFKEIILVLNASLREIEDRWANGKGPLANEFKADEVKRMIRALFQNTDRRAGVLSRIK